MSISVKIPYTQDTRSINNSRAKRLLSTDKEYATHMGLFDRFKDFFRTEKKADAIERLYNFVHRDTLAEDNTFTKTTKAFENLQTLAVAQKHDEFLIKLNPYNGVDFSIGGIVVNTYDNCLAEFGLYQINHYQDEMADVITYNINNRLQNMTAPTPMRQLEIDMVRQKGGMFAGNYVFNSTEKGREDTISMLHEFTNNLSQAQLNALIEVGSQSGIGHVYDALQSEPNLFWQNFMSVGVSPTTTIYKNADSNDITVIQTIRRMPNQMYYAAMGTEGAVDLYPTFELNVAFTVSDQGRVQCEMLNVSDTNTLGIFTLEDLHIHAQMN